MESLCAGVILGVGVEVENAGEIGFEAVIIVFSCRLGWDLDLQISY